MVEFFVTFQQRFRREEHPTHAEAHPDGWIVIEAPDYLAAQAAANERFGHRHWSMLYHEKPDTRFFPRGEVGRFAA